MTAKEKGQELVDKYLNYVECNFTDSNSEINNAKQCALIAVDEILSVGFFDTNDLYDYWHEVKKQIKEI